MRQVRVERGEMLRLWGLRDDGADEEVPCFGAEGGGGDQRLYFGAEVREAGGWVVGGLGGHVEEDGGAAGGGGGGGLGEVFTKRCRLRWVGAMRDIVWSLLSPYEAVDEDSSPSSEPSVGQDQLFEKMEYKNQFCPALLEKRGVQYIYIWGGGTSNSDRRSLVLLPLPRCRSAYSTLPSCTKVMANSLLSYLQSHISTVSARVSWGRELWSAG